MTVPVSLPSTALIKPHEPVPCPQPCPFGWVTDDLQVCLDTWACLSSDQCGFLLCRMAMLQAKAGRGPRDGQHLPAWASQIPRAFQTVGITGVCPQVQEDGCRSRSRVIYGCRYGALRGCQACTTGRALLIQGQQSCCVHKSNKHCVSATLLA